MSCPFYAHVAAAVDGINSGKYNEHSDVFAFAVVLYELVTRTKPWSGKTRPEILKLAQKKFEYDHDDFLEEGWDEAKQKERWYRRNPLASRRPDCSRIEQGCPPLLPGIMRQCW